MSEWFRWAVPAAVALTVGCREASVDESRGASVPSPVAAKLAQYTPVRLTADLKGLSEGERRLIPLLIEAAQEMDTIFWQQAYSSRDSLLSTITDSVTRRFLLLNYGPWDRLDANQAFVPGVGTRPPGGEFYPHDMTKEEFERAAAASPKAGEALRNLYTVVRRDSAGGLRAVPYHEAYADASGRAAA